MICTGRRDAAPATRTEEATMTTIEINGEHTEVPAGAVAYKFADPTESARWITDRVEARQIEREDPSLIVWADKKIATVTISEDTRVDHVGGADIIYAGEYIVEMPADYDPALVTADDLRLDPAIRILEEIR